MVPEGAKIARLLFNFKPDEFFIADGRYFVRDKKTIAAAVVICAFVLLQW